MATMIVGETRPYRAANGHTMTAPIYQIVDRIDAVPFTVWSYAGCTETCAACGGGDRPEWYAGEEW